ncbi:hypothetical protein CON74_25660 [Bacillus thuringiensis]|uniref:hypothetical protein n=1 Tax=Bacillus thuringiensis TaxID=1428 RepID=UPI000BED8733|nr:hypothetical protein [Bacillus thuringiensis]PEA58044.1 hypothetical protein CON74_25660 [Bacillus thuringiensis]
MKEYKLDDNDEEFISKPPSDRYGAYLVYSDKEQCIEVGETAVKGGFQKEAGIHIKLGELKETLEKFIAYALFFIIFFR